MISNKSLNFNGVNEKNKVISNLVMYHRINESTVKSIMYVRRGKGEQLRGNLNN